MAKRKAKAVKIKKESNIADKTAAEQVVETQAPAESEWQEKYTRLYAEFDNFKKRTQKEKAQLRTDATADAVAELLPVLDTLTLAAAVEVNDIEAKSVINGMEAILRKFIDTLEQMGVKRIEALGKEFDPAFHNAVMHIEDENAASNMVVEEFAAGYVYKDKVIRHSMVKVAN